MKGGELRHNKDASQFIAAVMSQMWPPISGCLVPASAERVQHELVKSCDARSRQLGEAHAQG